MMKWSRLLKRIWLVIIQIQHLPTLLDWLLRVTERSLAISIALSAFYLGYGLMTNTLTKDQKGVLLSLEQHWQAILLLLLPLFYLTVRTFLEEVQEAFGMKRRPLPGAEEPPEVFGISKHTPRGSGSKGIGVEGMN